MNRLMLALVIVAVMVTLVPTAGALVIMAKHEDIGPPPAGAFDPKQDGLDALRYAPGRCYWSSEDWSGFGQTSRKVVVACQGGMDQVNEMLTQFASLPAPSREIWLFPGPGTVKSLDRKITLACNWRIEATSRTQFPQGGKTATTAGNAVMIIYIERADPLVPPDVRARQWIKELNDDSFAVRQRAFRFLASLADGAVPLLRQALAEQHTLEQRRRIEQLLGRVSSTHLLRLKPPRGIPVLSFDTLFERELATWRGMKSWAASQTIADWAEYSEATLPILVEMIKDKRDYVRKQALDALGRLGGRAASVLPALEAAEADSRLNELLLGTDSAVASDLRRAREAIEKGSRVGVEDQWSRNRLLREQITQFCRVAAKRGRLADQ